MQVMMSQSILLIRQVELKVGAGVSGVPVTVGHSTSEVTVGDNLTVTGNLTVSGTTTTVNSTTVAID